MRNMRNHYIQKKFLELFVGDSGIYVYDLKNRRPLSMMKNASNIAFQKNLYQFYSNPVTDLEIERWIKQIEDPGIELISKIIETETLPNMEGLQKLYVYFLLQSMRTPCECQTQLELAEKINAYDGRYDYRDGVVSRFFDDKFYAAELFELCNYYDVYLLKMDKPLFFVTDCFCASLTVPTKDKIIPLCGHLALYLVQKGNKNKKIDLTQKDKVQLITESDYLKLVCDFSCTVDRWVFACYNDIVKKFIPKWYDIMFGREGHE